MWSKLSYIVETGIYPSRFTQIEKIVAGIVSALVENLILQRIHPLGKIGIVCGKLRFETELPPPDENKFQHRFFLHGYLQNLNIRIT